MKLEFIARKLRKDSKKYNDLLKFGVPIDKIEENIFIVIGEEKVKNYGECYKVQRVGEEMGLVMLGGLRIDETSVEILKSEFEEVNPSCYETVQLDIPKKYLSLGCVDEIKRLNSFDD